MGKAPFYPKAACGSTHQSEPVGAGGTPSMGDNLQARKRGLGRRVEEQEVPETPPPYAPGHILTEEAIQWLARGQIDIRVLDERRVDFYWCTGYYSTQLFCRRQLFITERGELMVADIFTG